MISRIITAIITLMFLISSCNRNPVDIDYDNIQNVNSIFPVHNIRSLVEADSTLYYGISTGYSRLYVITPGVPQDSSGSISKIQKDSSYYPDPNFFQFDSSEIYLASNYGIYKIHSQDSIELKVNIHNYSIWNTIYTITPDNQCIYISSCNTDSFYVHRYNKNGDSFEFSSHTPDSSYKVLDFAANDSSFIMLYIIDSDTINYHLDIYKNKDFIETIIFPFRKWEHTVFHTFFLENVIFINLQGGNEKLDHPHYRYSNTFYFYDLDSIDNNNFHETFFGHNLLPPKATSIKKYANHKEIYFHGPGNDQGFKLEKQYHSIFTWKIIKNRNNRFYDAVCFKNDSTIMLFDEYSQNFVVQNFYSD